VVKKPRKTFAAYDFHKRRRSLDPVEKSQTKSQTPAPDETMKDDSTKKIQPTILETFDKKKK